MDPYHLENSSKAIITETILLIVFLILSGIYLRIFILPINSFLDLNFQYISSLAIAFILNPVVGLFFNFLKKSRFKTLGFFIVSPTLLIFAKNVETFLLILSFLTILLTFYLFKKKKEYLYLKIYVQTILALISLLILYTFLSNTNYSEKVISRITKDFMSSSEYESIIGSIDIPFVNFVFNLITIFFYGIYILILFFPSFLTYVLLDKNNKPNDDLKPLNLSLTLSEPNKTNINATTLETKQEINQQNQIITQQNNQNLANQNNVTDQNPTSQNSTSNQIQNNNDKYAEIFKKYNLK